MSKEEELAFKEEMYLCKKNMGMSLDELYNMPKLERKAYISVHNKIAEEMKARMKGGG